MERDISWQGLSEFVAVVELGTFAAAAKHLGISRSHATKSIQKLEDRLKVRLMDRNTRGILLTDLGRSFYERAVKIIDLMRENEFLLKEENKIPAGKIKISVPAGIGELLLLPILKKFKMNYPDISLFINSSVHKVDLIKEEYDLAIRLTNRPTEGWITRKISNGGYRLCATSEYLRTHDPIQTPQDLLNHKCLVYTSSHSAVVDWPFHDRHGKEFTLNPSEFIASDSVSILVEACLDHMGIIYHSDYFTEPYIREARLVSLLQPFIPGNTGLWILFSNRKNMAHKIRLLVDFLSEGIS